MVKINSEHFKYQKNVNFLRNENGEQIKEDDKKENVCDMKGIGLNTPPAKAYKYVLEGGVIKIYLVENGITMECVKRIPLKDADPSILAQVENIGFLDILMILDIQKEENEKKKEGKNNIHDHKGYPEYDQKLNGFMNVER